jgi:hypothetical protein
MAGRELCFSAEHRLSRSCSRMPTWPSAGLNSIGLRGQPRRTR